MLTAQSTDPRPDAVQLSPFPADDSIVLHFGAIANIRTRDIGYGQITFDASHRFRGSWNWNDRTYQVHGIIELIDDAKRARVHLIIVHEEQTLFNEERFLEVRFID